MPRIPSHSPLIITTRLSYDTILNKPKSHIPTGIQNCSSYRRIEVRFKGYGAEEHNTGEEFKTSVCYEIGDKLMIDHADVNTVSPLRHTRVMSYWYATLENIFVDKRKPLFKRIWLQVRWLYRAIDLEDFLPAEADALLPYEVVESDHTSIVDFRTVQDRIDVNVVDDRASYTPWLDSPNGDAILQRWSVSVDIVLDENGLQNPVGMRMNHFSRCAVEDCQRPHYDFRAQQRFCDQCNRWSHVDCLLNAGKETSDKDALSMLPNLPDSPKFALCLLTPIARGGPLLLFGNGATVTVIRRIYDDFLENNILQTNWDEFVDVHDLWPSGVPCTHFRCVCNKRCI
ncbi:hypothetical protein JVU11DRAFT_9117 [Chiua virens]|nr:hypothetical protein JVU11DRAFT_9117 [Chiua virens]